MPERSALTGAPPPDFGAATGAPPTAMAALPPLAPEASPLPPPVLPSTPSLLGCLDSTAPRAGDGQQQAGTAMEATEPGLLPAAAGTYGVGRVGGQEVVDGEPNPGTDGDRGLKMGGGGKQPQCKNMKQNQRKKLNGSSLIKEKCQKVVKSQDKQLPDYRGRNTKPASAGLRSPKLTSSPGVNFLVRSAAAKRAKMAGSPKTPQPPSCSQIGSPSLHDLSPDTTAANSHASKRKPRKLISDIWREAEPIYKDGKLVQGKCIHCHQIFAASRDTGTSHMKRHLKVCEAKTSMDDMIAKMGRPDEIAPNWKYNPKLARRKLLKLVVMNEMPFSLVEYTAFREFTASLNPWFENISRTTIKNDCLDSFKYHGDLMKELFENASYRVSLTGDMWTSNQKLGYLCLTCHFVTDDWKLHKYIIRFVMLETPHNSVNMFNSVLNTLHDWNLEDKLFSFTLDNAAVNTAMVNSLRTNLKKKGFLVLEGKLLHFRCATHVLNLIVQDGLRVIKNIINNIRESVKYVGSSQSRIEKFDAIIIQEGLPTNTPSPDVASRWNSTFLMLQAALPLRSAFLSLENQDKEYTFAPLNSEWDLAEAVMKVLEVFYTATETLSGSKYPTSHLYFYQLWSIKNLLNKEGSILNRKIERNEASVQDKTIARMVEQMQTKFNQYWQETYLSACIPIVLDPRYKYDFLEFLLNDFGSEKEAETWMGEVKNNMQKLFNEYNKEVESQRDSDTQEVEDDNDPLAEWDQYMKSKRQQSSNELDQYLKEQLTPRKEKVDMLHWWKTKSEIYPVLSKIARDVLAIPASTVPSESAFSTGGRVISDYRSSLAPTTVESLICLQDWFKAADARKNE